MKIYAISGLGANEKVYERLVLPIGYNLYFIPWLIPQENETIDSYALRMSMNIDTTEEFILFGLSFGGIMAQEIAKIKHPQKLILFDTIKNEKEKPYWISINNYVPLYRIFPNFLLNNDRMIELYTWFLSMFNSDRPNLSQIYTFRDDRYTNWAFRQIIQWKNKDFDQSKTYHIHGTHDFVFPIYNISNPIKVKNGGHVAVYEKAEIVSEILRELL